MYDLNKKLEVQNNTLTSAFEDVYKTNEQNQLVAQSLKNPLKPLKN
ncbi:WSSV384 [White spot syndrome virus]|uniref:WSSV384 n=1 Tax=White spot syndrome virus TaxID=342409 RepID=A0A2I6SC69_9VIRU|nr:WSSV384 [White spot syndrome virus]